MENNIIFKEYEFLNEMFSVRERFKFKSMLSPKLKEMWEKIEQFEETYTIVRGYLEKEILPPPIYIGSLIRLTDELLDDFTFIVRHRLDEEIAKEFEKSVSNLKKKLEEHKKDVISVAMSNAVKQKQISIYIELASEFVLSYMKVVFVNFRESLTLISDLWKPMEKKFAEIAVKRVGVIPVEEEKKKGGEEL